MANEEKLSPEEVGGLLDESDKGIQWLRTSDLNNLLKLSDQLVKVERERNLASDPSCQLPLWTSIPRKLYNPLYSSKIRLRNLLGGPPASKNESQSRGRDRSTGSIVMKFSVLCPLGRILTQ